MDHRIKPEVDIIKDLLNAVLIDSPHSAFTQSLLNQYEERGGLSKKQLQGLYSKAQKIKNIPPGKLATLEAIILKRPTRFKSSLPEPDAEFKKDEEIGLLLNTILNKYPEHKRALFLRSKYENNETLLSTEITELKNFVKRTT
jgi:hypothetical protein